MIWNRGLDSIKIYIYSPSPTDCSTKNQSEGKSPDVKSLHSYSQLHQRTLEGQPPPALLENEGSGCSPAGQSPSIDPRFKGYSNALPNTAQAAA